MNYNINTDVNESEFEDIRAYNEITDEKTIHELLGDIIILNRYKNNFQYLFNRVVDVAALCWNNRDENGKKLQKTLIKFKVDIEDPQTRILQLNRFMISLCFLRPVYEYLEFIDIDKFLVDDYMSKKSRNKIQDEIVRTLGAYGKTIPERKEMLANMSSDLKNLLLVFSHADMKILTAENLFLDHYRESEIVREINNTEYPPDMQTAEIVEENKKRYELLEKEMVKRDNPIFVLNKYTKIIKPKQIEECYINFSQIPDGKDIVPVIMNGNGFKAGYHDMPVMYAGAIAARVPDMMNEDLMGKAGYFARNLWILTYGTISKTVFDCGSKNPIPVVIDEIELEMKEGRYYSEFPNSGRLKILKKTDTHLIGKRLWFRSPCTCNLNEDCCHVCYGTKALKVGELTGGFVYTTELATKEVGQKVLSAKHILKANSEMVEFTEGYDKYFSYENSTLIPIEDKKFDIYLKEDYLDEIGDSLTIYVTKDLIPIKIEKYSSINIPDEVISKAGKLVLVDDISYYKFSSSKVLDVAGMFCNITPVNIMMTQKYMNIMNLLENDITKFDKVEDVVAEFTRMLYGTIEVLSTHGEIIIGHLLRDTENRLLRPNWLVENAPYQILRLKTALTNHESVTVALAFEQTKHHLLHAIFDERNKINRVGPRSFEDFLFGEETL